MRTNRIFLSGGESVAYNALLRGDQSAAPAVLAQLGVKSGPFAHLPPHRWPTNDNGRVLVGLDMTQLPGGDGTPTKVEWLGLTALAGKDIAAAASFDFELKPNKYFRPGPLVIEDTISKNLVMTNLQIGGKPIFANNNAVPCVLFSHLCIVNALSSYVATSAAPVTFTLNNVHASATQTVRGVWVGDSQELNVG